MKLFLTSSVHAVAHDIAKRVDLAHGRELVFINTAAEPETGDTSWLGRDRQSLVDAGFSVTDYTLTGKSRGELEKDLKKFDYVYVSGGHTMHLLDQSHRSGFFELVKKLVKEDGKIYIGTSAGSIIAGPKVPDYLEDEDVQIADATGYQFVNFTILPHWGSNAFKGPYLGERLKMAYRQDQVPLLILTDDQYVCVNDDGMNIINVKGWISSKGR